MLTYLSVEDINFHSRDSPEVTSGTLFYFIV